MIPKDVLPHVSSVAASRGAPPACAASDLAVIQQRIDWLFRGSAPTRPMQQLREIVQRYRLKVPS